MESNPMSISEVVRVSGLQSSALRYYERQGLIKPTGRVGGRRQYDPAVVRRLAVIRLLQDVGFTIAEISDILTKAKGRQGWRHRAQDKLSEIDSQFQRIQDARNLLVSALNCDCSELDSCGLVHGRPTRHQRVIYGLTAKP